MSLFPHFQNYGSRIPSRNTRCQSPTRFGSTVGEGTWGPVEIPSLDARSPELPTPHPPSSLPASVGGVRVPAGLSVRVPAGLSVRVSAGLAVAAWAGPGRARWAGRGGPELGGAGRSRGTAAGGGGRRAAQEEKRRRPGGAERPGGGGPLGGVGRGAAGTARSS